MFHSVGFKLNQKTKRSVLEKERKSVDAGTKATGLNRYTFWEINYRLLANYVILCNYVRVYSLSVKELPLNINSY